MGETKTNIFKKIFQVIGKFFSSIFHKIKSHKIFTLVMMQLKDKWNLSFKTDKKGSLLKLSVYLLLFIVITVISYLIMDVAATRLSIFIGNKIPITAMGPLIAVLTLFEAISIFIGMTKSLFFAKDNAVLITYPVKSDYLFISKVIVYYIDALKKSCTMLLPILIAFGVIYGYPVYYYFWIILLDILYIAVITLICGLLSIPGFYVLKFFEKFKMIKIIFSVIVMGLLIYLSVTLINIIPSNINLIREYESFARSLNAFLYWFAKHFVVFTAITKMMCGVRNGLIVNAFTTYSWVGLLIMIGLIALLITGNMFLSRPFYTKMIANTAATKKTVSRDHHNHHKRQISSILHYEFVRIIRDEKLLASTIICVVVMPLITLVINKVYGSFETRRFGDVLVYIFNFFFIFLVTASHNISSSYIYSKDGPSWTVNKTMPVNPKISLSLRLVYNMIVSLLIIVPSSILFFVNFKGTGFSIVLFMLTLFVLSIFHNLMSASYDYSHSKNKDKADIGSEIVSSHELVSLAIAFLIGVICILLLVIFSLTGSTFIELRLFILASLVMIFGLYSFLRKIRLTYQEN